MMLRSSKISTPSSTHQPPFRNSVSSAKHPLKAMSASQSTSPSTEHDVIICGGGIISASIAYYLTKRGVKPLIVERTSVAAAASGKAGGFLARAWGDGTPTQPLHRVSFDLHEQLAKELNITSYRRVPTLSVRTSPTGRKSGSVPADASSWLNGKELVSASIMGGDTAQVTPYELTSALMASAVEAGAVVKHGVVTGIDTTTTPSGDRVVTAVCIDNEPIPCKKAVVAMGPWSVLAQDWLGVNVPLEGIKSVSVVYHDEQLKAAVSAAPYALFCNEDSRYGTHLEVYPRNNGEVYVCGIGGSDYVSGARLRPGGDTESQEKVVSDQARVAAAQKVLSGMSQLINGSPDVTQSCMRPCAPDAMPILGEVPNVEGAYLACGHNCWGILWAPVTGLAMSELLVDGKPKCVDLTPFSPKRFMPRGGPRGRKQGTATVGEQW